VFVAGVRVVEFGSKRVACPVYLRLFSPLSMRHDGVQICKIFAPFFLMCRVVVDSVGDNVMPEQPVFCGPDRLNSLVLAVLLLNGPLPVHDSARTVLRPQELMSELQKIP